MFLKFGNRNKLSDEDLAERYRKNGSEQLLGELFQRYTHLVLSICMKYLKDEDTAKDHTMQVFEELIYKLRQHEVSNFSSWLHMVTKNHCLMHLRKQGNKKHVIGNVHMLTQDVMENNLPEHQYDSNEKEEELVALENALEGLKEEQKRCISLFYLKKKSYQEISEETGYELKKVKSHIQNGKRKLKILLEQKR